MAHIPPKWVYINIVDECFLCILKVTGLKSKVDGQNDSLDRRGRVHGRPSIKLDGLAEVVPVLESGRLLSSFLTVHFDRPLWPSTLDITSDYDLFLDDLFLIGYLFFCFKYFRKKNWKILEIFFPGLSNGNVFVYSLFVFSGVVLMFRFLIKKLCNASISLSEIKKDSSPCVLELSKELGLPQSTF